MPQKTLLIVEDHGPTRSALHRYFTGRGWISRIDRNRTLERVAPKRATAGPSNAAATMCPSRSTKAASTQRPRPIPPGSAPAPSAILNPGLRIAAVGPRSYPRMWTSPLPGVPVPIVPGAGAGRGPPGRSTHAAVRA